MAGDWLKIERDTPDKPEVFEMALLLHIDPELVFTKLFKVWRWFDAHTKNGNAPVTVEPLLNRESGEKNFTNAMEKVGWLKRKGDRIVLPHFERHNGETSKARAVTKKRVRRHRSKICNGASVTKTGGSALPEKRREEKSNREGVSLARAREFAAAEFPDLDHAARDDCVGEWHSVRSGNRWRDANGKPVTDWQNDLKSWLYGKRPGVKTKNHGHRAAKKEREYDEGEIELRKL